jgi:cation diffusion facilitator CzcD-associated flavoprotein CzcO
MRRLSLYQAFTKFINSLFRLPNPKPPMPRVIPDTALYPLLRTNIPVPSMTYPGFPFPPSTPLYPGHEYVEAYHLQYASHFNILQNIRLRNSPSNVLDRDTKPWYWNITVCDEANNTQHEAFDHLVVATGNNHFPHIPKWAGQEDWLNYHSSQGPKREIIHSAWYREPQRSKGWRVLIVGVGSSGRDCFPDFFSRTRGWKHFYVSADAVRLTIF